MGWSMPAGRTRLSQQRWRLSRRTRARGGRTPRGARSAPRPGLPAPGLISGGGESCLRRTGVPRLLTAVGLGYWFRLLGPRSARLPLPPRSPAYYIRTYVRGVKSRFGRPRVPSNALVYSIHRGALTALRGGPPPTLRT